MKEREIFSNLTTTLPFVLRLDGRSFHRISKEFIKPYDENFSDYFVNTTLDLFTKSGLSPNFAYTFSDEISLYISESVFDCRIEKLNSVAAGFASSAYTLHAKNHEPIAFDCRVIPISKEQLPEYLSWRQAEAWRNHMNGYCQKLMIDEGMSSAAAQKKLDGMNAADLHELAFSKGINLGTTPAWQRRGICVYRKTVKREGFNPKTDEHVLTDRNIAFADKNVPLFKTPEGREWLFEKI